MPLDHVPSSPFPDRDAHVPFNRPYVAPRAYEYMRQAVERMHIAGDGAFTRACSARLKEITGAAHVLLTTSCTHALELSALLLNVRPGDEVIVPSFTFVTTANAFVLRGARPVFADVRQDTLNLDEAHLAELVTSRTRVIAPVHYAGVACEMEEIDRLAARHGIAVVEDNAHGLFGAYRGRPLGTFGALAALSFHETKNLSCGEGGALLINDPALVERAEIVREKGTNRTRFFRGQVDKYTWVDLGSSYLPSDLLAAFLFSQIEQAAWIQSTRRGIWERYWSGLHDWAATNGVRLPVIPDFCRQAYHMFYLLVPDLRARQSLIEHLAAERITAVFHYQPLHLSAMGQQFGGRPGDCPVAERVSDRLVRLPFYNDLDPATQDRIIDTVRRFIA